MLAAICAFALAFTAPPTATSVDLFGTETRVAAQTGPGDTFVAAGGLETPAFVGPNGVYAYDGMSGCCVAPRPGAGLNLPFAGDALRAKVDDVVRHFDEFGTPPQGVAQGGSRSFDWS